MKKECFRCHKIKDIDEFVKRSDIDYCKNCSNIDIRKRKIKKNTQDKNIQFLYNLYMRGETIDDCCVYFETTKESIIEVLNYYGIYPDQIDKLFCSKCRQMISFDQFEKK